MPRRNPNNRLLPWEIGMVKAMLAEGPKTDQDILAWFTRPTRSINHARIAAIREGHNHRNIPAASPVQLSRFRLEWPGINPDTGLHVRDDELLVKAREAMIQAVQCFNNPTSLFKSEIFIVVAVIGWTYLLHWHYRRVGVDYRHMAKDGSPILTKHGAEKHWELEMCLDSPSCPVDDVMKANLRFLIGIRHEIEHQMTRRIDAAISAKLQACCLNFNRSIKALAGDRLGLDRELSIAMQFSGIEREQRDLLLKDIDLPPNILAMHAAFEGELTDELIRDPRYGYRVALVEISVNSRGKADEVVEFVRSGSEKSDQVTRVMFKHAEKPKYKPKQIVAMMKEGGFPRFTVTDHSNLWNELEAKDPKRQFGVALREGDWWWYENWVERVRAHCEENRKKYA